LNLGDSYASAWVCNRRSTVGAGSLKNGKRADRPNRLVSGLKEKDLVGIPWMVAFALRADGWYLRSDIIWAKPNPMPESVTDRPTKSHEYLFLLTKQPRYFYDADAIREEFIEPAGGVAVERGEHGSANARAGTNGQPDRGNRRGFPRVQAGRNKRSVWTVSTQPYPGAHFATFPPKLIEPCILAGSPSKCCGKCGAPWERVVERTAMVVRPSEKRAAWQAEDDHARTQVGGTVLEPATSQTVGWRSTCEHDDDSGIPIVLDPFAGAGTTGLVALRHDRSFVGIELNPEYAEMARNRIRDDAPLLNVEAA
jgi:hypothetical protein